MKKGVLFLGLILLVGSCSSIMLEIKKDSSITNKIKILKHPKTQKEIVFLPAVHLGSADYYKSVKFNIDSLRNNGFTILYEGIGLDVQLDSLKHDQLDRKLRQVMGFYLTNYKDSTNKSITRGIRKSKYIMQNKGNTGIDIKRDIKVDLSKDSLITLYEQKIGPIVLSPCDLNTPLLAKYKCKTPKTTRKNVLLLDLRDNHLTNYILNTKNEKNAILYGKKHWGGIFTNLYKKGFRLVE